MPSYESANETTCVSFEKPLGIMGLSGLSTSLDVRMSVSRGLPSRFSHPPLQTT